LPTLLPLLPKGRRLIEPFVGGASVFLASDYPSYLLADANVDLIQLYRLVQQDVAAVIDAGQNLFTPTNMRDEAFRNHRKGFNTTRDALHKSALFLYLNKFGFNGLCRYNRRGELNVPYGKPAKLPRLPVSELEAFAARSANAEFRASDFVDVMKAASRGDVVYCDPPYLDTNHAASFTGYTKGGFNFDQQRELASIAEFLARKGVPVVISNHDTDDARHLYRNARLHTATVRRSISGVAQTRRPAAELIAVFE
jgi:DNA adenine methylase